MSRLIHGSSVPVAPTTTTMLEEASPSTIQRPGDWHHEKEGAREQNRQRMRSSPEPVLTAILPSTIQCQMCSSFIGPEYEARQLFFYPVTNQHMMLGAKLYYIKDSILFLCGECAKRIPIEDYRVFRRRAKGHPNARIKRRLPLPQEYEIIGSDDWAEGLAPYSQLQIQRWLVVLRRLCFIALHSTHRFLFAELGVAYRKAQILEEKRAALQARGKLKEHTLLGLTPVATVHVGQPEAISSLSTFFQQVEQRFMH